MKLYRFYLTLGCCCAMLACTAGLTSCADQDMGEDFAYNEMPDTDPLASFTGILRIGDVTYNDVILYDYGTSNSKTLSFTIREFPKAELEAAIAQSMSLEQPISIDGPLNLSMPYTFIDQFGQSDTTHMAFSPQPLAFGFTAAGGAFHTAAVQFMPQSVGGYFFLGANLYCYIPIVAMAMQLDGQFVPTFPALQYLFLGTVR